MKSVLLLILSILEDLAPGRRPELEAARASLDDTSPPAPPADPPPADPPPADPPPADPPPADPPPAPPINTAAIDAAENSIRQILTTLSADERAQVLLDLEKL